MLELWSHVFGQRLDLQSLRRTAVWRASLLRSLTMLRWADGWLDADAQRRYYRERVRRETGRLRL